MQPGDVVIWTPTGAPWFTVREVRVPGHTAARLMLSGLDAAGLTYSHSAPRTALVCVAA